MRNTFYLAVCYIQILIYNFKLFFIKNKKLPLNKTNNNRVYKLGCKEDLNEILNIYKKSFSDSHESETAELIMYLSKKPELTYVIRINKKIAGYAIFRDSTKLWLYSISIKDEFRGKGLAKELIQFSIKDILSEKKHKAIYLLVDRENNARFLYQNLAFNNMFYFSGKTKILMRKTIKTNENDM